MNTAKGLRWLAWLAVLTVAVGCGEPATTGTVFQGLSFDDALQKAKADNKLVMVDFSTEWCGYCKELDATTWKNARVQEWLRNKTVAIKLDGDRDEWLAKKYRVDSFPTLLFLKPDGSEVGRIDGYVDANDFLAEAKALVGRKAR